MCSAVVLRGPSQAGKSTFLAAVMDDGQGEAPAVGDGSGESVTRDTMLRTSKVGLLVDGPGDNDTMLRFSNEEAGLRYAVAVASAEATSVKFLVFDSLGSDTMQLRASLASLMVSFGAAALQGVVVVASKRDLCPSTVAERRLAAMRQVMQASGVAEPEIVTWQSVGLDEEAERSQLEALRSALGHVRGVSPTDLEDLWQRQRTRAQELCDRQVPRMVSVDVPEEYAEPYDVQEDYTEQEPYQAMETKSVMVEQAKLVWEEPRGPFLKGISFSESAHGASEEDVRKGSKGAYIYPRFEMTMDASEAIRGFSFVVNSDAAPGYEKIPFDLNKGARGTYNYLCVTRQGSEPPVTAVTFLKFESAFHGLQYNQWRVYPQDLLVNGKGKFVYVGYQQAQAQQKTVNVMVPHNTQVTVTKFRAVTKHRSVTRFKTATRVVSKMVEHRLQVADFHRQALDEIIAETRATFRQKPTIGLPDLDVRPEDSASQVNASAPAGPREDSGCEDSVLSSSSWISVPKGPRCFHPDALFKMASQPHECSVFLAGRDLMKGSLVEGAIGNCVLEVVKIAKHQAEEIVELQVGDFTLEITPSHRVLIPGFAGTASETSEVEAGRLQVGDLVMCSDGKARHVVRTELMKQRTEVLEITFIPDEAVAVFLPPDRAILTKGHLPKARKATRRSGMNRRGQRDIARDASMSIPDTAPGEYEE
eukprot:CAMPEP_0179062144 /NCGR_PEP_ID=MMETSP0796-20121207/26781_1 /TAXON_ID=73915 /ORGANISM="Pyrodinium bahamense, Strain pbaha01" /LENGTH=702 /DNA_ID=CAMNT_0020759051 /DNA_START=1 /DNA_END=2109 /DNA_ORIENTATION=+